jgi:hypothetical protein
MPQMNDKATCKHCSGEITWIEYYVTNSLSEEGYDVLDEWWAHTNHPDDDHDGEPV